MSVESDIGNGNWFAGEDKILNFTCIDEDTGAAQNISGWTMEWVLKHHEGGPAIVTKTPSITSAPAGTFSVTVASADTSNLPKGTYWHSVYRTNSGNVTELAYGDVAIRAR